jgi:cytochrome c-type biogenesis protein CcmH
MPLAIMRTTVQALPLDFNLDDSMAMRPEAKLSSQSHVTVKARISKSGQAMPQPGDLIGTLPRVAVGAKQVQLTISEVVK